MKDHYWEYCELCEHDGQGNVRRDAKSFIMIPMFARFSGYSCLEYTNFGMTVHAHS